MVKRTLVLIEAMKLFSSLLLIVGISSFAQGAVSSKSLESALTQNTKERMQKLKAQGPLVYGKLKTVAFDSGQPYQLRWRALMSMAMMGQRESVRDLESAVKSKD